MNNTNLYKREYKQGINPHLVNLQKGAPLLNMLNTQNQIFHLNNLNNKYLSPYQAFKIIPEENSSKVNKLKNHHTDHHRLLNFSYNHELSDVSFLQLNSGSTSIKMMENFDSTKVFAEKIQIITPRQKTQHYQNTRQTIFHSRNEEKKSRKQGPTQKRYSLPSNYSPEMPNAPSKKDSPSKELLLKSIEMNGPKSNKIPTNQRPLNRDVDHKLKIPSSNPASIKQQPNAILVENGASDCFLVNKSQARPPPAPPMDQNLIISAKKTSDDKPNLSPFDSVMDELKYKMQKMKKRLENGDLPSNRINTPDEKKETKKPPIRKTSPSKIEYDIDQLLTKVKDYKFDEETDAKLQHVASMPDTCTDFEFKDQLNLVKISDVSPSIDCVLKKSIRTPTPDQQKYKNIQPIKRNSVLAMAKYFEESFKPKEVKIIRRKHKFLSKHLNTVSPLTNDFSPTQHYQVLEKESKMIAGEKISRSRPRSLYSINGKIECENEISVISEVKPDFSSDLFNKSVFNKKSDKKENFKCRKRSNSLSNNKIYIIHSEPSKFQPISQVKHKNEIAPIYNDDETFAYYSKFSSKNNNTVDFSSRIETIPDFSSYSHKKPVGGNFVI